MSDLPRWLALAATPTFATMALWTMVAGDGRADMICSAQPGSPLSGMVLMYLLMAGFHLGPWLKIGVIPPAAGTSAPPTG